MPERRGDEAAYVLYFTETFLGAAGSERLVVYFVAAV